MAHKTALVSGGTSGVGLSIVRALAREGAHVHFIGTNADKGARIEQELEQAGHSSCRFIRLDLSDLRSVRDFARRFASEHAELDVLVNVAGVMLPDRSVTKEGMETTFAIGYLSAFVLCTELAPALKNANHARIANVSGAPMQVLKPSLDFDDLRFEKTYGGIPAAIRTVHAKTVLTEILAEKFRDDGVDVNAFHPGTVKSELGRNLAAPMSILLRVASTFMSNESKIGNYVSCSDAVTGLTGQLFVNKKPRPLGFEADYKDRLWRATERMVDEALATARAETGGG